MIETAETAMMYEDLEKVYKEYHDSLLCTCEQREHTHICYKHEILWLGTEEQTAIKKWILEINNGRA